MNKRSLTQQMLNSKKSFKDCGFSSVSSISFADCEQCASEMLERTIQFFPDGQYCYKPEWLAQINFLYIKYFTDIDTDPYDSPEGRETLWKYYNPTYLVPPEEVSRSWRLVCDTYENLRAQRCMLLQNENSIANQIRPLIDALSDVASSVALNPVDDSTLSSVVDAQTLIHGNKKTGESLVGFDFSKK